MLEPDPPDLNQLRNDRDGNLFRQYCGDIQADRHVHTLEALTWYALRFELFRDGSNLALTADHADVSRVRLDSPAKNVLVFLMPSRDDDHVGVFIRNDFFERLFKAFGIDRLSFGETLHVGINRAVVHDGCLESGDCCDLGDLSRDMTRTEDNYLGSRQDGF